MRYMLLAVVFCAAAPAAPALAQPFDPSECARIQDVDVPYEVATSQGAITFTSRGREIVVTAQSIRADGRTHSSTAVGRYHQTLTQFLSQARVTARAMNPMSRGGSGMRESGTSMCQAILDLAGSSALIEAEFSGYVSPVRIQLR